MTIKDVKKIVGHRRNFKLIGPGFIGCFNTGREARLVGRKGMYLVGYDNGDNKNAFYTNDRKEAMKKFCFFCRDAERYNKHALKEIQKARENRDVYTLGDFGVL